MTNIDFVVFFYADEEEVKGLCGLHKDHETADKSDRGIKRKLYPWMAFIFIQVNVYIFNLSSEFIC